MPNRHTIRRASCDARDRSPRAPVLNHPVDCGPCLRDTCNHDNECMLRISAAEVMQRVNTLMAEES